MKVDERGVIEKYKSAKGSLKIPPRYLEVFEFRVGISDGISHTQKEAAERFGISGTRVRQMEERLKYEPKRM